MKNKLIFILIILLFSYFVYATSFTVNLNSPEDNYYTTDRTPDFNFTVSGTETKYTCELFINESGYGHTRHYTNVSEASSNKCVSDVYQDGTYIYSVGYGGLIAYTITDSDITIIEQEENVKNTSIDGDGTYIYTADSSYLYAHTFNGTDFTLVGYVLTSYYNSDIYYENNYIYVGSTDGGIEAYTFNGTDFTLAGKSTATDLSIDGIDGNETYLYCVGSEGTYPNVIYQLYAYTFNGTNFTVIGNITACSPTKGVFVDKTFHKNYIYVADYDLAVSVFTFNGTDFELISSVNAPGFVISNTIGIEYDGTYIYVSPLNLVTVILSFNGTDVEYIESPSYNIDPYNYSCAGIYTTYHRTGSYGKYILSSAHGYNGGLKAYTYDTSNNTATILTANHSLSKGTYNWYINCTANGTTTQSATRTINIFDDNLTYSSATPYNNTINITNSSYLFNINAFTNVSIEVNGTGYREVTYTIPYNVSNITVYYNNGTQNTGATSSGNNVTWTYELTTDDTIYNTIYYILNNSLNATYTATSDTLTTSADNYQWNITLNLNMTQDLIPNANWTLSINYANLSDNTGYLTTTNHSYTNIKANTTTVVYAETILSDTSTYTKQTELATYQVDENFKDTFYKNIYITPTVKECNNWILSYWNNITWIEVTSNTDYNFTELSTTQLSYKLPDFTYANEYFKVSGTREGSGGGGGGGTTPEIIPDANFEITPSTMDILEGKIPAPMQTLGSACKKYHIHNLADTNTTLSIKATGEVFDGYTTDSLISLEYFEITIEGGQTETLEICVNYPTDYTETLTAQVIISGHNLAQTIDVYMNPGLLHYPEQFIKKYAVIISIVLIGGVLVATKLI